MRFIDLAWGGFVFACTTGHDPGYQALVSDRRFLQRLRTEPALQEFERLMVEEFLSERLGYPTVRPLTKFIDDYN